MVPDFRRLQEQLPAIQDALRAQRLDGWLLYDLHARNQVAVRLLGMGDLTRRYFVLIRARGDPCALVHEIEQAPWSAWPWEKRVYVGWRGLERSLADLLGRRSRIAMEYAGRDAVPALDRVPAGVKELVEAAGAAVVSSGDLVSRFHSSWDAEGLAAHRRSAAVLRDTAMDVFDRVARALAAGEELTEGAARAWVLDTLRANGAGVGAGAIVACGASAADPHYETGERGAPIRPGQLLLLDLWGKESGDAVYADQTWMAYTGVEPPDRVLDLWSIVRDARDRAVTFLEENWRIGAVLEGYRVDDAVRGLIMQRGYGHAFVHRTGHSIDQEIHGMGPNIDNLETHEVRRLIQGVGFSIEPGIYLPGDVGLRSEINVYMGEEGPEVTTPDPQPSLILLPVEA